MTEANIYIDKPIGDIEDNGVEVKGIRLIDVIAQVKAYPEAKSYLVHVNSPGGNVEDGNQIYDYLISLKQTAQVNTITAGDVGSIATKIYLAGTERYIYENHKFFIHNPWMASAGDAKQKMLEAKALEQTENSLRTFYQQATKIDAVGLSHLMDNEEDMSADQAVALGFATKKLKARTKAMAYLTNNKSQMDKGKENAIQESLNKILALVTKAFTPEAKAMVLELDGGGKVFVETEDASMLEGVSVYTVDEAGNATQEPAPDGEHKLMDGRVITVAGGKVASVAAAPAPTPDAAIAEKLAALEAQLTKITQSQTSPVGLQKELAKAIQAFKDSNKESESEEIKALKAELTEIKNQMSSVKVPVSAQRNFVVKPEEKRKLSPIQAYQRGEQNKK